jgi:hypothetical protein
MMTPRARKFMTVPVLLAIAGCLFLFRRTKKPRPPDPDQDALIDAMSEQSFPASDAPAYQP